MRKSVIMLTLVTIFALLFAACGGQEAPAQEAPQVSESSEAAPAAEPAKETTSEEPAPQVMQSGLTIGMATHEHPGDSTFWGTVELGAKDASAALGIELKSSGSGDPTEQAQIVDTYVSDGVDGIIVSLANPEAMQDSVKSAIDAGIPVITINSGVAVWKELGALTHVGQSEFPAGAGAGEQFNAIGLKNVICVVHEEANIGLEERCDGLESTFGGEIDRFNVSSTGTGDIAGTLASIQDKLIADDSIDGVLTLNPDVGIAARDAIAAAGVGDRVTLGTFDLSGPVLEAVSAGEILFAIDQQPYLQGYLPVVMLSLFNTNLNVVGGGNPVLTGPGFVTPDTADAVMELAAGGSR